VDNVLIHEIWETKEEKELSIGNLKCFHFLLAKNKFIKNPSLIVINKDTNWAIEISRRVISEWRSKSRTRERIISIQLLDIMIEGARYIKNIDDTKNKNGIESVSYLENQCYINGSLYKIHITVKKQKWLNRMFVYYYSATET